MNPTNDVLEQRIALLEEGVRLLFSNGLNYYVYQETPFNVSLLEKE